MSDVTIVIKAQNQAQAAMQAVKGDLEQIGRAAGGLKEQLANAAAEMGRIGMGLTAGVTLPVVGIAAAAINSAAGFEQALNVMQQVSGATEAQMASMQAQALQLGAETAFSAGEAAAGMLELAKAGLNADQVMAAIGGTMDLAAAGNMGLAQAAEISANAVNTFGLDATATVDVANMLAAAANASSVEVVDLAQGMNMAGSVFAASGQNIDDLTTAMALMGNAGIKGSDAGTSLKTMLMRLTAPTDGAIAVLNDLGVSMYNLDGSTRALPDVLRDLGAATGGMTDETRAMALTTLFGADAIRAVNVLMAEGSAGWAEMAEAVGQQGAATAVADARMRGMAGAIEYAKGSLDSFLIGSALPFLDTMGGIVRQVADAITWFGALAPPIKNAALAFTAVLAAAGPVMLALSGIATAIGFLMSPIGLVVVGLAALAAAWTSNLGGIQQIAADAFAPLIGWMTRVSGAFSSGAISIGSVFGELGAILFGLNTSVYDTADSIRDLVMVFTGSSAAASGAESALRSVGSALAAVVGAVSSVGAAFQKFGSSSAWSGLVKTVTGSVASIGASIDALFSGELSLTGLVGRIGESFNEIGAAVSDILGSADLGNLGDSILSALGLKDVDYGAVFLALREFVTGVVSSVTSFDWGGVVADVYGAATLAATGISSAVSSAFMSVDWGGILANVTGGLSSLAGSVSGAVGSVDWGGIGAGVSGLASSIATSITSLDWGGALGAAGDWLGGLVSGVAGSLSSVDWGAGLGAAGEWLGGLVGGIAASISSIDWGAGLGAAGDWLGGLVGSVASSVSALDWGTGFAGAGDWLVGLRNSVVGAVTGIDWGGAFTAAGETATGLRDGLFGWLTGAVTGIDWSKASIDFAGFIDSITASIESIDWSSIKAENVFAAMVAPVTAAIGALVWVFGSDSFGGLVSAVGSAIGSIQWGEMGGSFTGLTGAVGAAISGLDWSSVTNGLATAQANVAAVTEGTDWLAPLANLGSQANALRDEMVSNLTGAIADFDVSSIFSGFIDSMTEDVAAIDWSGLGTALGSSISSALTAIAWVFSPETWAGLLSAVTSGLSTAMKPETIKTAAVAAFATLAPTVAAGLAGIVWVFSSENWAGLGSAIKTSLTTIDWSSVTTSFEKLKNAVATGLGDFVSGFGAGFTWEWPVWEWPTWKWPALPTWEWPVWEWPALPEFAWPDFNEFHWPGFPEFHFPALPSFSWPGRPSWWPFGGDENQLGTSYFRGGWSWVGENGPELLRLPRGAEILSNQKSQQLVGAGSGLSFNVQQMTVRDDRDIYSIAYQVADLLARGAA